LEWGIWLLPGVFLDEIVPKAAGNGIWYARSQLVKLSSLSPNAENNCKLDMVVFGMPKNSADLFC
jgi:hypothetical protein